MGISELQLFVTKLRKTLSRKTTVNILQGLGTWHRHTGFAGRLFYS